MVKSRAEVGGGVWLLQAVYAWAKAHRYTGTQVRERVSPENEKVFSVV